MGDLLRTKVNVDIQSFKSLTPTAHKLYPKPQAAEGCHKEGSAAALMQGWMQAGYV